MAKTSGVNEEQDTESDEELDEINGEFTDHEESEFDYNERLRSHNLTPESSSDALRNRKVMSGSSKYILPPKRVPRESQSPSKDCQKQTTNPCLFFVVPILVIVIVGVFYVVINSKDGPKGQEMDKCTTSLILDKNSDVCKTQRLLCNAVSKAISRLVKDPDKPIMFVLLVHRSDINTAKCLSKVIASFGSCNLNTNGSLILTPRGFSYNTDEIIEKFKPIFEIYKSVVFENLIEMDVLALKAMHNFCDSHNPVVKPAIYTMIVISDDQIDYNNSQNCTQIVRNMLKKKFENIDTNKVQPLITRITDGPILPILPGEIKNCHEQSDYFEVV